MPEETAIDKLRKRLYRKGEEFKERDDTPGLKYYRKHAPEEWLGDIPEEKKAPNKPEPKKWGAYLLIIGLVVFAFAAIGFAVWYLFIGGTSSTKNISFFIEGQSSVVGGDLVKWDVVIINNAKVPIEFSEVAFDYPEGSKPFDSGSVKVISGTLRARIELGEISPGETKRQSFQAFVFGEKETFTKARALLEYRLDGSNVILAKAAEFELAITRSPIVVSVKAPDAINAGDEFNIEIEAISQSKDIIHNVVLEIEYPHGFTFKDSSPPVPGEKNNRWDIGDLAPNDRYLVRITGSVTGEEIEEKTFKVFAGVLKNDQLMVYGSEVAFVNIVKQFLEVKFKSNLGDGRVVSTNDIVYLDIFWKNNLPVGVENASLKIFITGKGVDERTITPEKGFYIGVEKAAVWIATSYPQFSFLEPGESGQVRVRFKVPESFQIRGQDDFNFNIQMEGIFSAPRNPAGYEEVNIAGSASLDLKVATDLQLARRGIYNYAIMPGTGPLPPKVGQETVYTVIWSLVNTTNNAANIRVVSKLPPYVSWKNRTLPHDANITYNEETREVVWFLNILQAGTGTIRPATEAQFQIGLIPSVIDVGKNPILMSEVQASGLDEYAQVIVSDTEPALTTDIRSDPQFFYGMGAVKP
ncbi:MAG: hypothetical protein COU46_00775 [Candidatus Niyogibacteria bacterium CG10_big_fil_rev_8_21_14_0_10_42_19]|uniref:DUF11 domain-containing protein n=1 Tax=Candidatus Niyogibacteria bacterium CG10_big_fil_rev_8_21_14_0_10_42_19 TaxID=1974725 RepID=A0A2H0TG93_9BACT|nr:MAG: hypothetical protein COU46_00775 [Candidatus Niyogibacteria bacterium CG10_big_fil_rev_8_21_14_0_10_42_19]